MRKTGHIKTGNGITWYYEQEGSGPHLVLVPDGLGDCKMFDKPMSLLASRGFTVTTFDMPGMSRSADAPADTYENVTPQKLASYVVSICDELGIDKASFWGCSSGGSTMLALVADHPERVVNAMAHEVPTYEMQDLLSMLELGDDEITSIMAGMLPEQTGNAEAWYALGDEYHARLHKNYARWARGYIRTLGSSFPVDRERLKGKPLDWSVGGSTPTARFFDNIVTAAQLGIPITHIPGCHFPYVTDVELFVNFWEQVDHCSRTDAFDDCTPAVFVAGFNSEDPGVEQAAQTLFEIDPDLVQADLGVKTLNGETIEQFKNKIPANVALGIFSCLKKCGIPVETPNQGNSDGGHPHPYGPPS